MAQTQILVLCPSYIMAVLNLNRKTQVRYMTGYARKKNFKPFSQTFPETNTTQQSNQITSIEQAEQDVFMKKKKAPITCNLKRKKVKF